MKYYRVTITPPQPLTPGEIGLQYSHVDYASRPGLTADRVFTNALRREPWVQDAMKRGGRGVVIHVEPQ